MQIRLIIPRALNSGAPFDPTPYVETACAIAGGATFWDASGAWYDERADRLYTDPVRVVECDCDSAKLPAFLILAGDICRDAKQACVYLRADGVVRLVRSDS
jgi:hypothetical protein